jgi:NADH:ubiquinone oxidoreductase subunit 4 (subunit M)
LLFSRLDIKANGEMRDLRGRQLAVMGVFAVAMIWLGVAPQPLLRRMELASSALVERVRAQSVDYAQGAADLSAGANTP